MNTISWLEKLVSIDTTSRLSNLALIETVRDALRARGVDSWLTHNAERNKANLFATLPARDGSTHGGIVLSGHTDVVPVDGQQWQSDPFVLTKKDDRYYARGACDMKGFIAAALALTPEFLEMPRAKPIHLAFSYDEEIGCVGAPSMLAELAARGIRPEGCVVGEPTGMQVIVAHKGLNVFSCKVHGNAAHSSLTPQGCNAIEYAARLITRLRELADTIRAQGPYDQAFDVPFTTLSTNQIRGGIALNTIPDACEFIFEFRNLPGLAPDRVLEQIESYIEETLLPAMRREHAQAGITIERLAAAPAFEGAEQAAITQLTRALTRDNEVRKVAYGTEAGLFQKIGVPTVICGPGDIDRAHKADEFVTAAQLQQCEDFLRRVGRSLCDTPA